MKTRGVKMFSRRFHATAVAAMIATGAQCWAGEKPKAKNQARFVSNPELSDLLRENAPAAPNSGQPHGITGASARGYRSLAGGPAVKSKSAQPEPHGPKNLSNRATRDNSRKAPPSNPSSGGTMSAGAGYLAIGGGAAIETPSSSHNGVITINGSYFASDANTFTFPTSKAPLDAPLDSSSHAGLIMTMIGPTSFQGADLNPLTGAQPPSYSGGGNLSLQANRATLLPPPTFFSYGEVLGSTLRFTEIRDEPATHRVVTQESPNQAPPSQALGPSAATYLYGGSSFATLSAGNVIPGGGVPIALHAANVSLDPLMPADLTNLLAGPSLSAMGSNLLSANRIEQYEFTLGSNGVLQLAPDLFAAHSIFFVSNFFGINELVEPTNSALGEQGPFFEFFASASVPAAPLYQPDTGQTFFSGSITPIPEPLPAAFGAAALALVFARRRSAKPSRAASSV